MGSGRLRARSGTQRGDGGHNGRGLRPAREKGVDVTGGDCVGPAIVASVSGVGKSVPWTQRATTGFGGRGESTDPVGKLLRDGREGESAVAPEGAPHQRVDRSTGRRGRRSVVLLQHFTLRQQGQQGNNPKTNNSRRNTGMDYV